MVVWTKLKLKAHVLDERVSNLKRLLKTGLPIFLLFLGILPKRPDMVANERIVLSDFYSFNVRQNLSTHFTRSNYGYLNSIIIIIMVTATINENDGLVLHVSILKSKNLKANRG